MFTHHYTNLLDDTADALVNPVNTIGIMGAGLAKQFGDRWPVMRRQYHWQCKAGRLVPGRLHTWETPEGQVIINFPTKIHWQSKSRLLHIEQGLQALRTYLLDHPTIKSIALPALGCGLGGLRWDVVDRLIQQYLADLPLDVRVYPPQN